jgi:hypothetical protein
MKHAGPAALDGIEELLAALRARPALRERKRGIFYLKSKAFLHFHEDPAGVFADVLHAGEATRFRVVTKREQQAMLAHVDALLTAPAQSKQARAER